MPTLPRAHVRMISPYPASGIEVTSVEVEEVFLESASETVTMESVPAGTITITPEMLWGGMMGLLVVGVFMLFHVVSHLRKRSKARKKASPKKKVRALGLFLGLLLGGIVQAQEVTPMTLEAVDDLLIFTKEEIISGSRNSYPAPGTITLDQSYFVGNDTPSGQISPSYRAGVSLQTAISTKGIVVTFAAAGSPYEYIFQYQIQNNTSIWNELQNLTEGEFFEDSFSYEIIERLAPGETFPPGITRNADRGTITIRINGSGQGSNPPAEVPPSKGVLLTPTPGQWHSAHPDSKARHIAVRGGLKNEDNSTILHQGISQAKVILDHGGGQKEIIVDPSTIQRSAENIFFSLIADIPTDYAPIQGDAIAVGLSVELTVGGVIYVLPLQNDQGDPETIQIDSVLPNITVTGGGQEGVYQKDPIEVTMDCQDAGSSCSPDGFRTFPWTFSVKGNFCDDDTKCSSEAIRHMEFCDQAGNCALGESSTFGYDPIPHEFIIDDHEEAPHRGWKLTGKDPGRRYMINGYSWSTRTRKYIAAHRNYDMEVLFKDPDPEIMDNPGDDENSCIVRSDSFGWCGVMVGQGERDCCVGTWYRRNTYRVLYHEHLCQVAGFLEPYQGFCRRERTTCFNDWGEQGVYDSRGFCELSTCPTSTLLGDKRKGQSIGRCYPDPDYDF